MENEGKIPIIDFTSLPVSGTITLLRTIGQHLLTCVLKGLQPDLLEQLNQDQARLLVTHLGRTPRPSRQFYAHKSWTSSLPARVRDHVLRLLRQDKRFPFAQSVEMMISGQLSTASFVARTGDELSYALELPEGYHFPADLWGILGRYAWDDLQFRHHIVEVLERELRSRTLFSAALKPQENNEPRDHPFPTMHLTPQLFWLLISMAVSTIHFKRSYRILPARRRIRKALLLLQKEGLRQGLMPEWAGLWDQWVLLEAATHWNMEQLSDDLQQVLAELPLALFRARSIRLSEDNMGGLIKAINQTQGEQRPQKVAIAQKNWADRMPGWFAQWNQDRR